MILVDSNGEKQVVVMEGDSEFKILREMCWLALAKHDWNVTRAAKSIGINRTTLSMRITKWNLRPPHDKPSASPAAH